jgi:hypothetical protein
MKFKYILLVALTLCIHAESTKCQWIQLGGYGGGEVNCFAFNGENIFAATSYWGVILSTDKGKSWSKVLNPGEHSFTIDGANLPTGTYYARITTPIGETRMIKLVKE